MEPNDEDLKIFVDGVRVPYWIGPITLVPAGSGKPATERIYIKFVSDEEQESYMSLEFVGPFGDNLYKFTVDGYEVPYLNASKIGETESGWSGDWNLILDNRFSVIMNTDQIENYLWFIANAMAVAAGYTCHGPSSVPRNLFGPSVPTPVRTNPYYALVEINEGLGLEDVAKDAPVETHTTEDDFQHFLSYSNLSGEKPDAIALLRKAYFAGAGK